MEFSAKELRQTRKKELSGFSPDELRNLLREICTRRHQVFESGGPLDEASDDLDESLIFELLREREGVARAVAS